MPIAGLGTDIIQIDRLELQLQKSDRLASRILTRTEKQQFDQDKFPTRFLAKRFAAKEAAVKALGTGIGNGISWQQIEVRNHPSGQPHLVFSGHFAELCERRGINSSFVSISDEQDYAVATVLLEQK